MAEFAGDESWDAGFDQAVDEGLFGLESAACGVDDDVWVDILKEWPERCGVYADCVEDGVDVVRRCWRVRVCDVDCVYIVVG